MGKTKSFFTVVLLLLAAVLLWPNWKSGDIGSTFSFTPSAVNAQTGPSEVLKGEVFEEELEGIPDPLEPVNRAFFTFNDKLYFWVLKPASKVYKMFVPTQLRISIDNAFYNLKGPIRVVNNFLQGNFKSSGVEAANFLINTTLGFGGLFDPAKKEFKLGRYKADFGQTLGVYGMKPGFYLIIPLLGPSSGRDAVGLGGDFLASPLTYISLFVEDDYSLWIPVKAGEVINYTSLHIGEYEDFKRAALDPYISMRNAYYQYRENMIRQSGNRD